MTHVELRDLLIGRVGWKQPTSFEFTLDAITLQSDSGRYFQDEYPMVTLKNLFATTQEIYSTDASANSFLQDLAKSTCIQVVGDVFEVSDIVDDVLEGKENIFDDCISKRMAITVGEIIINSTRSNYLETVTKEQQQKIFFELNGNADSTSSRANPNFPTYVGLKSRYGRAIRLVKDSLGQEQMLDVTTFRLPNFDNNDELILL